MKIEIAISPCPNDVFVFAGILSGQVSRPWLGGFHYEDVETLNRLARGGAFDLIKISYANAPFCDGYTLLGCGGALGRGCGPLLLTGGDDWDPAREVLVPGERTTANFLLDFWAGRALRKRFLPFNALYRELRERRDAQGVVIHEMRFTYARDGLRLVQDLGSHWEGQTGHPIPLGAIAYRARPSLPSVAEVEEAIRASLDWAWANEQDALRLCASHAQSMEPAVLKAHVELYVNEFTRDLGSSGLAAVRALLSRVR
jgi:1,4-dihydroxy-6-naphthoate synthase